MEIVIVIIVLIALAVILGVPYSLIGAALLGLMAAGFFVLTGYFAFCAVRILRSKKVQASVSSVRTSEKFNYPTAYYDVDGNIYANAFPCELVMRKQLYTEGRACGVYVCERKNKEPIVYDPNAVLSTFVGFFLALGAGAATAMTAVMVAGI